MIIKAILPATFLITTLCMPAVAADYELIDLGTMGGVSSIGEDINNSGQVTGKITYLNPDQNDYDEDVLRAFFYDGSKMHEIGTLYTSHDRSYGSGINDNCDIAGTSADIGFWGDHGYKAFRYNENGMQDLNQLLPSTCNLGSRAFDINDNGAVTGTCAYSIDTTWGTEQIRAFLFDGNTMRDLGSIVGDYWSVGNAINNNGHVTGFTRLGNDFHAFVYDGRKMLDLQTLGGQHSHGRDINDSGHVVGGSYISMDEYTYHAFLYDGTMHDLGSLAGPDEFSDAYGINNSSHVVGRSRTANGDYAAFLFDGNEMLDLCVLTDCIAKGWTNLGSANAINDKGDITGYGEINGEIHAFLVLADSQTIPSEVCSDGVDNDGDSKIDCEDTEDCAQDQSCQTLPPQPEVCDDGIDNDQNGLTDCADKVCRQTFLACKPSSGGGGGGTGGGGSGGGGGKNK
jgi:probable HAF family extracellular repeat protein